MSESLYDMLAREAKSKVEVRHENYARREQTFGGRVVNQVLGAVHPGYVLDKQERNMTYHEPGDSWVQEQRDALKYRDTSNDFYERQADAGGGAAYHELKDISERNPNQLELPLASKGELSQSQMQALARSTVPNVDWTSIPSKGADHAPQRQQELSRSMGVSM